MHHRRRSILVPFAGAAAAALLALAAYSQPSPPAGRVRQESAPADAHPLDPLSAAELAAAAGLVQSDARFPQGALFSALALNEPPKSEVLRHRRGDTFRREASAVLFHLTRNLLVEVVVDLRTRRITSWKPVPGAQPWMLIEEFSLIPALVKADPRWQEAMRRRRIQDPERVIVVPIAPGQIEAGEPQDARIARVIAFDGSMTRPIENVLALVDVTRRRVLQVVDGEVIPPSTTPTGLDERSTAPQRQAPAPLQVLQPAGPSFVVAGSEVRWQNWRFRFGMDHREGLVLYTVRYLDGGRERSILYRASLSELVVPYGDPSVPHWSFRAPFDLGEYGMGRRSSQLQVGTDVPENSRLFPATFADDLGRPVTLPDTVALYERDGGVLWRHGEEAGVQARRARQLVLGTTSTLGNYDYGLNWVFHQDGSLEMEALLTGVMLTRGVRQTMEPQHGEGAPEQYGHLVAPHLVAVHHQHFFNFRLDMDIERPASNSAVELNTQPVAMGPANPAGNGFRMSETLLPTELQAQRDLNLATDRRWKVINSQLRNGHGRPVGYTLVPGENAVPQQAPASTIRRRAGFTNHHLWVTRYDPAQRYAAGEYIYQKTSADGLPVWTRANRPIREQDIVLWYTMGTTHLPRPEEWPVMPVHRAGFRLAPSDFFDRNPALDVPAPAGVRGSGPAR